MHDWRYPYRPDRSDDSRWDLWKMERKKLRPGGESPIVVLWILGAVIVLFVGAVLYWSL
jgi:hypothetical protein